MAVHLHLASPVIALALLAAACGGGDEMPASSLSVGPLDTTTTAPASGLPASTDDVDTTDDVGVSNSTVPSNTVPSKTVPANTVPSNTVPSTVPLADLPGEAVDFGPRPGDLLAVVGVSSNDVLNLREAPGADQAVVGRLDPLADGLVAEGNTRALSTSFWFQLTADGVTGWASAGFIGYLGGTDDATAELVALAGETPVGETLVDLAGTVAALVASDEPPSRIRVSGAPTVADLGEVTVDIVGVGDDSVLGYRLHLFATPHESGEGWVLASVERTVLCARGTDGELCV